MMHQTTVEAEQERGREIAREYASRGYRVILEPTGEQLPDFLAFHRPALVAYGRDEAVIVEVKSRRSLGHSSDLKRIAETVETQPGWRFELVVVNRNDEAALDVAVSTLDRQEILSRLEEVNALLHASHTDAALLLAWSFAEATLRLLARSEELEIRRPEPTYLLKQLATHAAISQSDYQLLMAALQQRNSVAHGFRTEATTAELVHNLAETVGHLLEMVPDPAPA